MIAKITEEERYPSRGGCGAIKIKVLLVDDHAAMRRGLSTLLDLNDDIEIVGEASNGEEAVETARRLNPDVILMDIRMPKLNGIEATRIIHAEFPEIRIIGLSTYDGSDYVGAMKEAGAAGFCSKSDTSAVLLAAIRGQACGWPC
jgi:DNA-binding NarL/FixJ family response regulator